jgi:DNA sulfur modification protein DndB
MIEPLPGLAHGDGLRSIYAQKSKSFDEKSITAGNPDALAKKLEGEKLDGWSVLRENKWSIRLKKDKPADRQLEDELWCLLHDMGFKELNSGRTFSIEIADDTTPRQLDVFAKDDETAFIVECTQSKDSGPRSVKALIDKIGSIRPKIINAIHKHYGRKPALKVKFAIATRNIEWRDTDRKYCESSGIALITHDDLAYFQKLTSFLRTAARYQFLGRYLRGEGVEGLRTTVPATRGRMGGRVFYNFLMSPYDLLKITYISHKAKTSNDDLETYQRIVKPARLKAIGRYIDEGGKFPTNIVVNLKADSKPQFDLKERFDDTATGILHLPGLYGTAWVIDGQHRLYGYAHATRGEDADKSVVPVLAYEDLPLKDEIQLFVDINTQQVKVPRNLVNEIISSLNIEDPDAAKRLDAIQARIVIRLDEYPSSPVRDRILTVAQEKDHSRCLTLTSFADGIAENNFVGTTHRSNRKDPGVILPGPLADPAGNPSATMEKTVVAVSRYLGLFADQLEAHWRLGDDKGGYLCTNNGIRALLLLLRKVLTFLETKNGMKAGIMTADDIVEAVAPYIKHVVDYFADASATDIGAFRSRGSSLLSVSQNCFQMMSIINERESSFVTNELAEYIASRDIEGTKEAKDLIDEINRIIFNDVISKLKAKYGTVKDTWWIQGVTKSIRKACDDRWNESDGERERHQFLTFSNYPEILLNGDNWDEFKDYYSFPEKGKRKKTDQIAWIQKLTLSRNITHHAEKGPLRKEDVEYVRRVHRLVKKHIGGQEKVVSGTWYLSDDAGAGAEMETEAAVA